MAAPRPVESIPDLLSELVRIPSRAGVDPYEPVFEAIGGWLRQRRVDCRFVLDERKSPIALWGRIDGRGPGPCYLLNATVDTAPFGEERRWTHPPLSAARAGGWLYGRGSGDSKSGIAIFCHVIEDLARDAAKWSGSLMFVFDADEHTGSFGGIRRFMEAERAEQPIAGALIGYPGNERIAIGGRGFARAKVTVHGKAAHTGSSTRHGVNAVSRAAQLVEAIHRQALQADPGPFALPPQMTVTAVQGGDGFSIVPDVCVLNVDIRLSLYFGRQRAEQLLARLVGELDQRAPGVPKSGIDWLQSWPAYQLEASNPMVRALTGAVSKVLGRDLPAEVVGPSSVANYLSTLGVPAVNGFGVRCENIHGVDERIALETIEPVFEVYRSALRALLMA